MPELPEVETVRRGIAPVMEGAVINKATLNRPDLRWPFPENMSERLTGQRVEHVGRRSKYILCALSSGETLLIHLGMSGRLLVSGDPLGLFVHDHPMQERHDHVILDLDNGTRITMNDPRRFGAMDLFKASDAKTHPLLKKLGPEPLGNQFDAEYLQNRLSGRRSTMKSALLDQRIVAGLGNIYVCEALNRAQIAPTRSGGTLTDTEAERLIIVIRDVLHEAIAAGGSSLRDYRQASGELGYFQHNFVAYGREGQDCKTPGCCGKIARIVQSGRSTFYCLQCQR